VNTEVKALRQLFTVGTANFPDNPDARAFESFYQQRQLDAAVLIAITCYDDQPSVILTQRAMHLKDHPGQISLPGGRIEALDLSPVEAALREAQEEIGLPPGHVDVLGRMGHYFTISGFRVVPVVGLVHQPVNFIPDPSEVADILSVPLNCVLNPDRYQTHQRLHPQKWRTVYSIDYQEAHIWGITAGILRGLCYSVIANQNNLAH